MLCFSGEFNYFVSLLIILNCHTFTINIVNVLELMFLLQVETCKDRITAALETLRPTTSWERSTGAVQGLDGVLMGGRGFGVAMESLFKYLGSEYGNTFALGAI